MMLRHRTPVSGRAALASLLALLLAAVWTEPSAAQSPATTAKAKTALKSPERWEKAVRAFEDADKATPPRQGAVLFIGASNTVRWKTLAEDFPETTVVNRGFGGSQTSDLVHFADRLVLPYKPRLIVVNVGGNDLNAGKSPERVLADNKALVAKIRAALPGVRIVFQGLNPSPARWVQAEKQKEVNRLLKEFTQSGDDLDFVDLWDAFLGPDGQPRAELFVADRLHNNPAGFKIRAEAIRPHLR